MVEANVKKTIDWWEKQPRLSVANKTILEGYNYAKIKLTNAEGLVLKLLDAGIDMRTKDSKKYAGAMRVFEILADRRKYPDKFKDELIATINNEIQKNKISDDFSFLDISSISSKMTDGKTLISGYNIDENQQDEETKEPPKKQNDQRVAKVAKSVRDQLEQRREYNLDDLQRQINRDDDYQNLTNQQREVFIHMTKIENILESLSKHIKLVPDQSKKSGGQLMILGKYYPIDQIALGIRKLLKDVSNISGNIDQQQIGYQNKKQPFKRVLKLKEQTKFKPTLNQLFQTRKVLC